MKQFVPLAAYFCCTLQAGAMEPVSIGSDGHFQPPKEVMTSFNNINPQPYPNDNALGSEQFHEAMPQGYRPRGNENRYNGQVETIPAGYIPRGKENVFNGQPYQETFPTSSYRSNGDEIRQNGQFHKEGMPSGSYNAPIINNRPYRQPYQDSMTSSSYQSFGNGPNGQPVHGIPSGNHMPHGNNLNEGVPSGNYMPHGNNLNEGVPSGNHMPHGNNLNEGVPSGNHMPYGNNLNEGVPSGSYMPYGNNPNDGVPSGSYMPYGNDNGFSGSPQPFQGPSYQQNGGNYPSNDPFYQKNSNYYPQNDSYYFPSESFQQPSQEIIQECSYGSNEEKPSFLNNSLGKLFNFENYSNPIIDVYTSNAFGKTIGVDHSYSTVGVWLATANENNLNYFNAAYSHLWNGSNAFNLGIGGRYGTPEIGAGASLYYDYRQHHSGYFNQISPAFEGWYDSWETRINLYLPLNSRISYNKFSASFPGGYHISSRDSLLSCQLATFLFGKRFELTNYYLPNFTVVPMVGPYWVSHSEKRNRYGFLAEVDFSFYNLFSVTALLSRDSIFKTRFEAVVTLTIPLGCDWLDTINSCFNRLYMRPNRLNIVSAKKSSFCKRNW